MFHWTVHLTEAPNSDCHHAAVAVGDKLYSFARDRDSDRIHVYIFNTVSLRWRNLLPVTTGGQRPHEVTYIMYLGHTAVLIDDIVYIWGGGNTAFKYYNGLHAFDVDAHTWFKPRISGYVPEGRRFHSACVLGKVMYVHGGFISATELTNNIDKLDTTTMVWSLINTRGSASSRHSATIIGTKMFVFGGWRDAYFNDYSIRVFDTETNSWLNTPSAQLPASRSRGDHSAFAYKGELYIFGGKNKIQKFHLWKFNPETLSWKKVEPKGKGPSPTCRMCCCVVGDRIILFTSIVVLSSDLHVLDFRPTLKTLCKLAVFQYGLEKLELPHNLRWELHTEK